jgi:hypothetical protein
LIWCIHFYDSEWVILSQHLVHSLLYFGHTPLVWSGFKLFCRCFSRIESIKLPYLGLFASFGCSGEIKGKSGRVSGKSKDALSSVIKNMKSDSHFESKLIFHLLVSSWEAPAHWWKHDVISCYLTYVVKCHVTINRLNSLTHSEYGGDKWLTRVGLLGLTPFIIGMECKCFSCAIIPSWERNLLVVVLSYSPWRSSHLSWDLPDGWG